MAVRNYRDLFAWQKAMDLVEVIYQLTAGFPREELYGLTSQLRRAGVSIPSNIAEGEGRWTTNEFVHFLSTAHSSLYEVETQLFISQRLRFVGEAQCNGAFELTAEVGRLVNGLANSLRKP